MVVRLYFVIVADVFESMLPIAKSLRVILFKL